MKGNVFHVVFRDEMCSWTSLRVFRFFVVNAFAGRSSNSFKANYNIFTVINLDCKIWEEDKGTNTKLRVIAAIKHVAMSPKQVQRCSKARYMQGVANFHYFVV